MFCTAPRQCLGHPAGIAPKMLSGSGLSPTLRNLANSQLRLSFCFTPCRFSHGTMPINNLFRNCGYYWLFTAFVAYFINHPLYTSPSATRALVCLSIALLCQACNFRWSPHS